MKESTNSASQLNQQQRLELELLHSLLEEADASYPWHPADPAAAPYFDELQAAFAEGDLTADIFNSQWSQVAQLTQQLWAATTDSLVTALVQRFGTQMPRDLMSQLAAGAQAAAESGRSLIDQLVESAQAVLNDWNAEDLQVVARPLALAMRGGQEEILEVTLRSIRPVEWSALSEVEQARLSLAIARYALDTLATDAE
ncbi:MAG TPA: hypothetical protein V6D02_04510 [Candidatus Obscuribacterales bacterium]